MKSYAESKKVSISALVEYHFKNISTPVKHKNIIDLVEQLEKPLIGEHLDLKKAFYENQAQKYGF